MFDQSIAEDGGNWKNPTFPKSEWELIGIEIVKIGEDSEICQMCCYKKIRNVYIMKHKRMNDTLRVGCECARKISRSPEYIDKTEKTLKELMKQEKKFSKKTWTLNLNGSYYLKFDNYFLLIYSNNNKYKIKVTNNTIKQDFWGVKEYDSFDDAKTNAYEALIWAQKKSAKSGGTCAQH